MHSPERLDPGQLEIAVVHPRGIRYTVGDIFRRYLAHDAAQLTQVKDLASQIARMRSG